MIDSTPNSMKNVYAQQAPAAKTGKLKIRFGYGASKAVHDAFKENDYEETSSEEQFSFYWGGPSAAPLLLKRL